MAKNYTAFIEADEGGTIAVANALITGSSFLSRQEYGRLTLDEGAAAITDGFDYTVFFKLSNAAIRVQLFKFAISDSPDDMAALYTAGTPAFMFGFITSSAGVKQIVLQRVDGPSSVVFNLLNKTWIAGNLYCADITRSGSTVTILVYDEDGGHGTPGALWATRTLTGVEDAQYLYGMSGWDDDPASNGSVDFEIGPLTDNNASVVLQDDAAAIALLMENIRAN